MAEFPSLIDEDANLRANLAALGPAALRDLEDVLTWSQTDRDAFLQSLVGRRESRTARAVARNRGYGPGSAPSAATGDARPWMKIRS
jgi:hypothetical protein